MLCATAGTPTTLAAINMGMDYEHYDGEAVNGEVLRMDDVDKIYSKLLKVSMNDRARLVGVGRADLIMTGIVIFKEIFEASGLHECIVFDDGLREGVAIAKCRKIDF
jgi:exopolyphosphatase/guanosine-5'-triphosphate,3'-diphosphate pyrophosphatase